MGITKEHYAWVYQELDTEAADVLRAARAEFTCSECGSEDGMQGGWTREAIINIQPMWVCQLYAYRGDNDELYTPCWQCNPWRVIPDGYTPLTPTQIAAWCEEK